MTDRASDTATLFSKALQSGPLQAAAEQRLARQLLASTDPFERLVPLRLLGEALAPALEGDAHAADPLVLFMDRLGGRGGIHKASAVIELLAARSDRATLVHVSFATPHRGLGALVRASLTRAGADSGVLVDVVAHNCPADQLRLGEDDVQRLTADCDLVLTYAPGGIAGVGPVAPDRAADRLLERSDLAVLSYPDPEAAVADLDGYERIVTTEPGIDALRFWVQARTADGYEELGHTELGPEGDAEQRLWALLDNARRLPYRLLIDPLCDGLPAGAPIICPCRTLIEEELAANLEVERIVPAGNRLVAVARRTFPGGRTR